MEVDPALQPPGALGTGQRVLKTSIDDYDDTSWKNEFEKGDFLNMIKAEKLDGLKKLLGHSKWNSKSANLASECGVSSCLRFRSSKPHSISLCKHRKCAQGVPSGSNRTGEWAR
eukprot:2870541-Rhodomonas_salina.1